MAEPDHQNGPGEQKDVVQQIGDQAAHKLKHRGRRRRSVWFGLGMFGLVGWAVALPTLIGTALGIWIDENFSDGRSWTVACLLAGLVIGCVNAWYWIKKESRNDD